MPRAFPGRWGGPIAPHAATDSRPENALVKHHRPLVSCLRQQQEPRIERARRHELLDLLALCVLATICGADSMVAIEEFGKAQQQWLRTFLALPHGISSHDTVGRALARLDAAQFEACFLGWVQNAFALIQGQVVAIDSKSVRRSRDRWQGQSAS